MTKSMQHNETETTLFRHAYGPRYRLSISTPERELPFGRTKQSFKAESDINTIMAKFQKTGLIDFVNEHQPQYADCTGVEYQTAMDVIANANTLFEELPASWRKRFDNDPAEFLEFVGNPANRAEGIKLGIINPGATPLPGGSKEEAIEPLKPASGHVPKEPKGG